jgi:hypothetical protein
VKPDGTDRAFRAIGRARRGAAALRKRAAKLEAEAVTLQRHADELDAFLTQTAASLAGASPGPAAGALAG